VKYFRLTPDYILHDISYVNLIMMLATIPTFKDENEVEEDPEEISASELEKMFS
jgi:hypothetical protein